MLEQGADGLQLAALVLVIGSAFVATNLDNLLILVGLLGGGARQSAAILFGYLAAAVTVLFVALLGGALGGLIDPALVGYLGLIPLLLGGYLLYGALFRPETPATAEGPAEPGVDPRLASAVSAFALMVSNSGDSIALFVPLFAESERDALVLEIAAYLALILAWAGLAKLIAGLLRRYGRVLVPLIMMAVGTYILLDTATDTLK